MSAMQRADFRKELQLGLYGTFGLSYSDWKTEWTDIFESNKSEKAFEEEVLLTGLGVADDTGEGESIKFDSGGEGWVARYKHKKITKAFALTEEAVDDNVVHDLGSLYAKSAARSMRIREEVDGAAVLNNGFNAASVWGDGVSLFSTAHPLSGPMGGVGANTFVTQADLSEDALGDACNAIEKMTDERGIPIMIRSKKLVVPVDLQFTAHRILFSDLRPGTANNDTNALKDMKAIPDGYATNHFLTDPDAWFVLTDADQGFRHFERKGVKKTSQYRFETGNMEVKFVKRYSFGVTNWRAGFGSSG